MRREMLETCAATYILGSRFPEIVHSVRSMSLATPQPRTSRTNARHLIEALAERLQVPIEQVDEIYWEQVDRLAADARIHDFLAVLALRNARAILRGGCRLEDSKSA